MVQWTIKIINITLTLIFLMGCSNYQGPISKSTERIDQQIDQARSKQLIKDAEPEFKAINNETKEIRNLENSLLKDSKNKDETIEELKKSNNKEINKLNKEIADLKESNAKLFKSVIGWAIFTSTIGFGVSIALFLMGNLKSLTLSITFLGVIAGALLAQFIFKTEMIWFIGIGAIVIIFLIIGIKKIIHANRDLILTGEEVKKEMPDRFEKVANNIQDKSTKEIVKQVRTKLKAKGIIKPIITKRVIDDSQRQTDQGTLFQ